MSTAYILHNSYRWLERWIIFIHRWLGMALCLLFVVWFVTGLGMV